MNLKMYHAPTMAEALADVKRDLGRDAVILHTRSYRKGGFLGLGGRSMWEITAAPNMNVPRRRPSGKYVPNPPARNEILDAPELEALEQPAAAVLDGAPATSPSFLAQQMAELRRMVESLVARQGGAAESLPAELAQVQAQLLAQDVAPETAQSVLDVLRMNLTGEQLADAPLVRSKALELLTSLIAVAGTEGGAGGTPARPEGKMPSPREGETRASRGRVIALIGPTGVGKTTTIAKLAANFKLREGRKVGLITIDTYRIAAVDQLRTYADIIEVPLQTVLTAGELHQTVRSMRGLDVVLIDTAGRSQNDRLRLNQLRSFLSSAEADEVHLVVSSTANRRCVTSTLERFIPLGANRIILTKLDEAATFGSILNVASAGKVPISYVTTGQDVPEDITPADSHRLAGWILDGGMGERRYAT